MPVQSEVLQSIVKAIAPLDENRLLVAAKDGLYIFHHREYKASYQVTFQLLNENSGYPDIEPGFNGLFVASDGRIWVTSASGVSALDPKKLSLQGAALGVRITEVDGARQPFNVRSDWIPLEYGRDEVEIVFEAIGFQRPSRTLYQYRLDGNEWTDWSEVDRVFLSNLREGRHQFEVRTGPSDQYFVGTPYDKFYFEVSLPFWREAWFAPIAIVFAAGLLIFGLTALWNQRQNRIQLEARLNEVRQLRSQLLLAELNPHFVFNALASIQHQVLLGDREAAADHLVRLSRLIRSFLQATHRGQELAAGVAERDISLAEELTLLGDYLHFERLKNEQHFDYKIEVDPSIDPQTTFVPPMMLQPFVENGIKHGLLPGPAGGLLSLHFTYLDEEGQQLRVMITDNGVGIQEKTERKKFPNQESLGRSIIEERVRLLNQLGYSIRVETRPAEPKGTKVVIDFRELD
jgi:two-component sensor histidine kinase